MKYVKAYWDDSRGDEFDHWGNTMYYFEYDDDLYPTRQIQVYDNGNSLKYAHNDCLEDRYGMLSDQPLSLEDMPCEKQSEEEFQEKWEKCGVVDGKSQWNS